MRPATANRLQWRNDATRAFAGDQRARPARQEPLLLRLAVVWRQPRRASAVQYLAARAITAAHVRSTARSCARPETTTAARGHTVRGHQRAGARAASRARR